MGGFFLCVCFVVCWGGGVVVVVVCFFCLFWKVLSCVRYCFLQIIREVIDIHSGELTKLWQEEREEEAKPSQHSNRYC